MKKSYEVKSVIFDKNLNRIIKSDPIFEAFFKNIYSLTDLNAFIAQNGMMDEKFLNTLNMSGIGQNFCYHCLDLKDTFEFNFFLLPESWSIVNKTGCNNTNDALTGLLSEQSIFSLLKHEIYRSARNKETTTVLIIDIKHLKNVNEMFGFLTGDYVIKEISKVLKHNTRASDALGRYKGDKFIVSLQKTDTNGAMTYIQKLEEAINRIEFCFNDFNFDVDLNFGITICKEGDTIITLLDRMNLALNKVKKSDSSHVECLL